MNAQDRAVMQQALTWMDEIHPGNMTPMAEEVWNKSRAALRQLLEQPEQEHALEQALTRLQKRYSELEAKVGAQPAQVQGPYSAPIKHLWNAAPKPWVGLTDEERRHLRKCNQQHDAFAIAIEAKLKEKNT